MSKNSNETQIINVEINQKHQLSPNPLSPDFKEPMKYGDYTKLELGENRLRILSEGIVGCEYWIEVFDQESGKMKKKAIRRPLEEATSLEVPDWHYFYAFYLWNYKATKIQILSTAIQGVNRGIKTLTDNQKWGNPMYYNICITKTQTDPSDKKSTRYSVTPEPHTVLDPEIAQKWEKSGFSREDLFLLFDNLDPFAIRREQQQAIKANN